MSAQKKAAGDSGSIKGDCGSTNSVFEAENSLILEQSTLKRALAMLNKNANQERRALLQLANNLFTQTSEMNAVAGVNISDVACSLNKKINVLGYEVRCKLPVSPIINRFGEPTNQHIWFISKLQKND